MGNVILAEESPPAAENCYCCVLAIHVFVGPKPPLAEGATAFPVTLSGGVMCDFPLRHLQNFVTPGCWPSEPPPPKSPSLRPHKERCRSPENFSGIIPL